MTRLRRAAVVAALLGALAPGGVRAQADAAPPSAAGVPRTLAVPAWPGRLDVRTRPLAPVSGVALALPVGSSGDPTGEEGGTWILADAVVRTVEARLGPGTVQGSARVEPERTTFTFVVRNDAVEALLEALHRVAFETGPDAVAVSAAREARVADLVFQQDSPVGEVNRAARTLIYGSSEDRVHAPGGTLGSVEVLDPAAVERIRRAGFDPARSVVSVVGAVAGAPVPDSTDASPAPRTMTGRVPAPTTSPDPPWTQGSRQVVEREVTNSWIMVAWPVPGSLSRIAVDFIAHRMERELNPSPPDPGVFSATVEVVEMPEGEALVVRAAVQPRQGDAMEARILGLPERLATPLDDTFFLWYRRQFRAERLMADAAPEAAAQRRAREILARGSALEVEDDVWELTPEAVASATAGLGAPRVLFYGPPRAGN